MPKFLSKKLTAKNKKLLAKTKDKKKLIDIYEEAIGGKVVVNQQTEVAREIINDLSDSSIKSIASFRKKNKKKLKLTDLIKLDEIKNDVEQNKRNFELTNRLLFIQELVQQDEDLRNRKLPLIAPFWMNFCGEKTKVAENILNNVEPIDRVDALCKQHDIDYDIATTPQDARNADLKMLASLKELSEQKDLSNKESFNRDLVEFMMSNKVILEDKGIITKGSFAGIEKKLNDEQLELVVQNLNDMSRVDVGIIETINDIVGIRENEFEIILDDLIKAKGGIKNVSPDEYRSAVFDILRDKNVADLDIYSDGKFIDNFIFDIYIKRQKDMPPKITKKAKVREQIQKLIDAKTNVEDYPPEFLKKGVISSNQMRQIISRHNGKRIVQSGLKRKEMRIPLSGNANTVLENINRVVNKLKDGVQDNEKASDADKYINFITKIQNDEELTSDEEKEMNKLTKKLGKTRILALTNQANVLRRSQQRLDDDIEKEKKKEKKKEKEVEPEKKEKEKKPIKIKITKKKKSARPPFKDIAGDRFDKLSRGLRARPNILALLATGAISTSDVEKLEKELKDLSDKLVSSNVSFEKKEQREIASLLKRVNDDISSIPEDGTSTEFNAINSIIASDVDDVLKLLEVEQQEEGRAVEEIEEKEAKFEEKKISTEFKLESPVEPDIRVKSEVALEEKKQTPTEDKLNTSTNPNINNLPRDRRPFFFTLGTDLITKTDEQEEEDIETFANFSWIPKDGNFYNGEDNVIVQAQRANDIIRYDLNNQFGGLWMPQAPQPIFKLTPRVPLYEKMRVSLAPIIQHEQKREADINPRATPGRIKLYSQDVSGMSDTLRRNNILNRDIFPNVVDGIRV